MRQFQRIGVIGLTMLASSVLFAGGQSPKSEIDAFFKKYEAAYKKKDLKAIFGQMTSDFTYKDLKGTVHKRAQVQETMTKQFAATKSVDVIKTELSNLVANGSTVTITCKSYTKVKVIDQNKKEHTIESTGVTNDVLVKQGGVWKVKSVEEKSRNSKLDGKSMN